LDNVTLVGAGSDDGGTGEATHLAPGGIDLAVEIVTPIVQFGEQFGRENLVVCLGGGQELAEHGLITLPFLLQRLDPDVEPRQGDVVVKIEGISDLFVDVLARVGDLFITRLASVCDPLRRSSTFAGSSGRSAVARSSRRT
jgi:hypothetical protein